MLKDRKIHYLLAHPCIIQPGNFTGWGSEGVNIDTNSKEGSIVVTTRPVPWTYIYIYTIYVHALYPLNQVHYARLDFLNSSC